VLSVNDKIQYRKDIRSTEKRAQRPRVRSFKFRVAGLRVSVYGLESCSKGDFEGAVLLWLQPLAVDIVLDRRLVHL
jgi:hypothetical protein